MHSMLACLQSMASVHDDQAAFELGLCSEYAAPELLQGFAHPASDLYSAGALLLHLLSGEPACSHA